MMASKNKKAERRTKTPPGSEILIGVGQPALGRHTTMRCLARHDVPWSERCILDRTHVLAAHPDTAAHKDKKGRTW